MEEALATLALSTQERENAIIEQLVNVDVLQNKDQDTAFVLEFIGGILGFLGIGYMYSGLTNAGLIRLVGMWTFLFVTWSIALSLTFFSVGFVIMPFLFVAQVVLAYFSAKDLKQSIFFAKAAQIADQDDNFIGYLEGNTSQASVRPFQKRNRPRNKKY